MKNTFLLVPALLFLSACGSQPIIPTKEDVNVTREDLSKNSSCENLGTASGKSMHTTGGKDQALEDLKEQAANKGATDIQVHQFSDMGTSVTGTLFKCM